MFDRPPLMPLSPPVSPGSYSIAWGPSVLDRPLRDSRERHSGIEVNNKALAHPQSFGGHNLDESEHAQRQAQLDIQHSRLSGYTSCSSLFQFAASQYRRESVSLQPVTNPGPPSMSCRNSTENTPDGQLTPKSPTARQDDDDLYEVDADDQIEDVENPALTPAERRALKRKMKRFRLTHSQTRFLMNEFARQAHPDAAHRERLSQEIPGLSPRQVQVWFQNRRAKLKRLTVEDQERMMRSRTLPPNFNVAQTLCSPFVGQAADSGLQVPLVDSYASYPVPNTVGALGASIADLSSYAQQYASPTSVTPTLGAFGYNSPHYAKSAGLPNGLSPYDVCQRVNDSPMQSSLGTIHGRDILYPTEAQLHQSLSPERINRSDGDVTASPMLQDVSQWTGRSPQSHQQDRSTTFHSTSPYGLPRPHPERAVAYSSPSHVRGNYTSTDVHSPDLNHHPELPPSSIHRGSTTNMTADVGQNQRASYVPGHTYPPQYTPSAYDRISQALPPSQVSTGMSWQSGAHEPPYQ